MSFQPHQLIVRMIPVPVIECMVNEYDEEDFCFDGYGSLPMSDCNLHNIVAEPGPSYPEYQEDEDEDAAFIRAAAGTHLAGTDLFPDDMRPSWNVGDKCMAIWSQENE